jgi:hypothetical protein
MRQAAMQVQQPTSPARPERLPSRPTLVVALALACLGAAIPAAAQEPPDTTKSRIDLIRERLRSATPVIPDSAQLAADSARADSLAQAATRQRDQRAGPLPRDSIMTQLLRLDGYVVTEYKADSARFVSDSSRLRLSRQAQVVQEGQSIVADSTIIFDQNTNIACAHGAPTVSGAGESPLQADSLCYNVDTRRGRAFSVLTEVTEGANWIVRSDESFVVGDTLYSHTGIFTDCSLEEPHYHFGAGELKYVGRDIIVARDVTLNFQDVPVFWLPFFVQSTKQGRRSGILTPRFGVNDLARTSSSYQRRVENVGLFWAISDYMGAELALDWQSQNFTALRGTFNYRFLRQFLAGSVSYRNFWEAEGGTQFTLATQTSWQPNERTDLQGNVSYATSTRFVRQRSIDPRELNQSIDSNVGLRRRFDWGNLSMSGRRSQQIQDNTVNLTLPSLNLSLNSITLFEAQPGEEKWYSNATLTASADSRYRTKSIDNETASSGARGDSELTGSMQSSFTLGKLGISQNVQYANSVLDERLFPNDTALMALPRRELTRINWSTGVSFQQRLVGSTTFTPGLSLRGELVQGDTTGGDRVAGPTRMDFTAALRTDLFGFLPGVGPIERIRHKISPSFTYSYSPAPTVTARQEEVFGALNVREQNRISIGISQTFEGKPRQSTDSTATQALGGIQGIGGGAQPGDSLTQTLAPQAQDTSTGPRRQQRIQPITLLSISTDAVVYDWVQARDGIGGVQTAEVGNNIQSDLLRGLQLSFAHDLFDEKTDSAGVMTRDFKPHLSRLTMSFSIDADSWFARLIGLGRSREEAQQAPPEEAPQDTGRVAPQVEDTGAQFGLLGNSNDRMAPRMPTGTWRASLNYTMRRPRSGSPGNEDQMLTANMSLQPTAQWSLNWSTGYSFTRGEFTDHILTLTRAMHDWDANFDFVKAQNGNFSFQFRVQLRANPEFKIDYDQRDLPGIERTDIAR